MTPRRALPSLLLSALALLGTAEGQEPKEQFIVRLSVGYEGRVADHAGIVSPVWLTLQNPRSRQVELRVRARSDESLVEERVVLAPGGRQRLCLALEVRERRVLVELYEGSAVLDGRLVKELKPLHENRHVLSLDARPGRKSSSRPEDGVLPFSSIPPQLTPTEPACFRPFGIVIAREADGDLWTNDQRSALLEHVANGGTLVVTGVSSKRPKAIAFVEGIPGTIERRKMLGRPVEIRRLGLGRVVSFPDDLLGAAFGSSPRSAQLKQSLADMVKYARSGKGLARLFQGDVDVTFAERPGFTTKCLLATFALTYLLAVGPVLGVTLRKSTRARLALVTLILVIGFSVLAVVVAGMVRVGKGTAYAREVLYVPPGGGPSLHLSDVTVLSGGAINYDMRLSGLEMAANVIPGGTEQIRTWQAGGWEYGTPNMTYARTQRGDDLDLSLDMAPWDRQSVATQGLAGLNKPLDAVMRRTKLGYEVTVTNTSSQRLDAVVVMEESAGLSVRTPFVDLGALEPGATVTGLVRRGTGRRPRRPSREEESWFKALGVPSDWTSWAQVVPHPPRSMALRYVVVSRVAPRLRVTGSNLDSVSYCLRLDPVSVEGQVERGWLGLSVQAGNRYTNNNQVHEEVKIARVDKGGPAQKVGLKKGLVINMINGDGITSVRQFQTAMSRFLPGEQVRVSAYDPQVGGQRNYTVKLAARHEIGAR